MVTRGNRNTSSNRPTRRGPRTSSGTILSPPRQSQYHQQHRQQRDFAGVDHFNNNHLNFNLNLKHHGSSSSRRLPQNTTESATMSDDDDDDIGVYDNDSSSSSSEHRSQHHKQRRQRQQQVIKVIAPATLQEGYTFEASVGGKTFTVTVPKNGVVKDEEFHVPYPSFDDFDDVIIDSDDDCDYNKNDNGTPVANRHHGNDKEEEDNDDEYEDSNCSTNSTPMDDTTIMGQWRTTLCSCCDVMTQSTFWIGLVCPIILIAQVMTRLELNWVGQEAQSKQQATMTYNIITGILIFSLLLWSIPFVGTFMAVMVFFFTIYIGMHTRAYMRRHYRISPTIQYCYYCDKSTNGGTSSNKNEGKKQQPEQPKPSSLGFCSSDVLDDCCCMLFCTCCTTIQMARHTHNDKEYPGYCCTSTGLEMDAPEIV